MNQQNNKPIANMELVAELFYQLSEREQDALIAMIKSLLSER